jgi:hypothetical protein
MTLTTPAPLTNAGDLELPDLAALGWDFPALADAIAKYDRLRAERRAAGAELAALAQAGRQAADADAADYQAALLAGDGKAPDPGTANADAHRTATEAARRRVDALTGALDLQAGVIAGVLDAEREVRQAEVAGLLAGAVSDLQEAVERFGAARHRRSELRALARWVEEFPSGTLRFRKGSDGPIQGLIGRNDDPFTAADVIAALRQDAAG